MPYASTTSILLVVPGLPQTTTATGYTACAAVVDRHIARADALINSKISKRYSTPITPTPPLLASLSEDITTYYSYRSFYSQDNYNKYDNFDELKNMALDTLEQLRQGEIDLVDSSGGVIPEREGGEVSILDSNTKDSPSFFDIDDSTEWKFNDDLMDTVEDGRS